MYDFKKNKNKMLFVGIRVAYKQKRAISDPFFTANIHIMIVNDAVAHYSYT